MVNGTVTVGCNRGGRGCTQTDFHTLKCSDWMHRETNVTVREKKGVLIIAYLGYLPEREDSLVSNPISEWIEKQGIQGKMCIFSSIFYAK